MIKSIGHLSLIIIFAISIAPIDAKAFDLYFDEYGKIEWKDEKIRLLNFEQFLLRNPNTIGYIGFHWGNKSEFAEMKQRIKRARDFLLNRRKLSRSRLVIVTGRQQDYPLTILQPVRKGSPAPVF
jgi:hypothetical protein